MSKQPTFEKNLPTLRNPLSLSKKNYPTLRNPLNTHQNLENYATLRKTSSITLQPALTAITNNDNFVKGNQKIAPNTNIITTANTSNSAHIMFINNEIYRQHSNENPFPNTSGDALQDIILDNDEDLLLEDSFLTPSRSISPSALSTEYDNENSSEHDNDNENSNDDSSKDYIQISAGQKNCYDNAELPECTGNSGPYFPNITSMWMFIWFTKNMIGIVPKTTTSTSIIIYY